MSKPVIYILKTNQSAYWKITREPMARKNIGIIEHNGYLNVKLNFYDMINAAGGDFRQAPEFQLSPGCSHGVGGSGYYAWASFEDVATVKSYLRRYFLVQE